MLMGNDTAARATAPPSAATLSPYANAPDRPVFVGACPRSGTTLLRTMLNNHPDLAMPRESRFLLEVWRRRAAFGDLGYVDNRRALAQWIFTRRKTRPGRMRVRPERAIERLVAAPPTLGSLIGTCFVLYAERHGKSRWGDKRPMYVQNLDAIFAMFPDAQFVHVVRDPRAAVASMRKLDWYDGSVVPAAELWERSLRAADAWRGRLAADQFLEVRYEDLVSQPVETLQGLLSFLRLPAGGIENMLSYHEENDLPEASRYHWRVHQPVTQESLRRWEEELTREETALVERVAGRRMRRYGYEPVASRTEPPAGMRRSLRQRRAAMAKKRVRRALRETKLRFTYPYPVAAKLSTAARAEPRQHRVSRRS